MSFVSSPDASPNPAARPQSGKVAFRDSRWRPVLCCGAALGLGLALAPLVLTADESPARAEAASVPEIALASENTLIVQPALPPGVLLRGRIRLVAGATDALGRAPVGGQVARHLVESGARVERGDAIVEISSGAARRAAPASEFRQNRAEQGQIAASDAQNALAQKISIAQTQLRAAQERVARAQEQNSQARDVVRRLQNGQSVTPAEIPSPFRGPGESQTRARRSNPNPAPQEDGATQIASRQAEAARQAAQESAQALQSARDTLADTQNAAQRAREKSQSAAKSVTDVEARFDEKKASGADVDTARALQKEAQNALDNADKALVFAKTEVTKREKNAATTASYARSSADEAARSLASARLEAANDENRETSESLPADAAVPSVRVTLENAIRYASAALDESRRASRAAERIAGEIEGYQSQVARSKTRIDAANEDLIQAQQSVMDSVPRARFTTSFAPSSGIVTWISRLAREVGAGDPIFGLARGQRVAARFEDKSGLWRAIKPGARLSAFVVNAPSPGATQPEPNPETSPAPVQPAAVATLGAGQAVELKMTEIETPKFDGAPGKLTGAIISSGQGEDLPEGAQILVSMPRPNQKATLSVPASALITRGDATFVGVLAPLSAREIAAREEAKKPAPSESKIGLIESHGEAFHLRWTRVETGRGDGLRLEITGGLKPGMRVVAAPEELEAMGFAPPKEIRPTVFDTDGATPISDATSDSAPESASTLEVLVRLTPMLG